MTGTARVLVLSGPSSAGKSTLGAAFRDRRAECGDLWFRVGIDLVLAEFPGPWVDVGWPGGPGRYAAEGMRVVDGERIAVGPVLRRLLRSYQQLVSTVARSGVQVLVDDCILDETMWDDWQRALEGLDVRWVAVTADPSVLTERERARGDRRRDDRRFTPRSVEVRKWVRGAFPFPGRSLKFRREPDMILPSQGAPPWTIIATDWTACRSM